MTNAPVPNAAGPGSARSGEVPAEVDRWNWGAFLLHWIWGIGNSTYIAFLVFIPIFGWLIMPFVLGAKGSAWAWRNRSWESVAEFRRVQRLWAIWGVVAWLGVIAFGAGLYGIVTYMMTSSEAYRLGVERVQASPEAVKRLGTPITAGLPMGSFRFDGARGEAELSFSASGPKAKGSVLVQATKTLDAWTLRTLLLKVEGDDEPIDLLNGVGRPL